jgi:hypothetical protein
MPINAAAMGFGESEVIGKRAMVIPTWARMGH